MIKDGNDDVTSEPVRTTLGGSEDDEDEGGIPNKEGSSLGVIPEEEFDAGARRHPARTATPLPSLIPQPPLTDPNAHDMVPRTSCMSPPVPVVSNSVVTPSNLASIPSSAKPNFTNAAESRTTECNPPQSEGFNHNSSGLRLPSPDNISWEQNAGFTSMTDEFNFAMSSIDMDYPTSLEDLSLSNGHAALLQQNSMPHGGVDMTYNMGMSNMYWQDFNHNDTTNFSVNNPSNLVQAIQLPDTSQAPFNSTTPTFPSLSNATSNTSSVCTISPAVDVDVSSSITLNQPGVSPLDAPVVAAGSTMPSQPGVSTPNGSSLTKDSTDIARGKSHRQRKDGGIMAS